MKKPYFIPLLLFVLGLAMLILMVIEEGEPGALPLFITMLGVAWFVVIRVQMRRKNRRRKK